MCRYRRSTEPRGGAGCVCAWGGVTSDLPLLTGSYDAGLVFLGALPSLAMCYAGFELTERIMAARGRVRSIWLICGGAAMGIGLWASDYVALLAFQLPVPIHYHYPTVVLALLVAIFLPMMGLSAASQERRGIGIAVTASIVVGAGMAAIPLIDVAAMRLPARIEHRWALTIISTGFAIVIFLLVLVLVFSVLYRRRAQVSGKLMGAVVLGSAIAALPYMSLASVRFHPANLAVDLRYTMDRSWLGVVAITGTVLLILTGTITASILEGMLESEHAIASAAHDAEIQFRTLAEAIPQIVWTTDPEGLTTYINRRWYEMTGMPVEGSLGSGWMEAVHPDDRDICQQKWKQSLRSGEAFAIEYRLRDAAQGYRWYLDRAVPLRDASGAMIKWFGTCTDIDDQMHTQQLLEEQVKQHTAALLAANARLQEESIRDGLTHLYNRRYLEDSLERETRRAVRAEQGLGVIMLDLDHFKEFNDKYGHDAGDTVLRETATVLLKSVRAEDIVCRYGGEEFLIIVPMADLKTCRARAEHIRSKLHELNLLHHGQTLGKVTVSAGVARLPQHGTSVEELIKAADAALYQAKREGRDRVATAEVLGSPEVTGLEAAFD